MNTLRFSARTRSSRATWIHIVAWGTWVTTLLTGLHIQAAPPWGTPQMKPGISAVTCAPPKLDVTGLIAIPASNAFVFGMFDFNAPPPSLYGPNGMSAPLWNPPMHHEDSWNAQVLGNVFGIAIDSDGDTYVAANGLYGPGYGGSAFHTRYGDLGGGASSLAAAGTIYKIDRISGAPSVFAVLPQQAMSLSASWSSGPGIGNVAYDAGNNQFFATNLEDGKIYRISNAGALLPPAFDPLTPDDGAAGMPPDDQRLWGIAVYGGQVYYAVWNVGDVASPGKIRRVDLDGSGAILPATDTEVLTVPGSSTLIADWNTKYVPVSDIEFSADGKTMLLGQRSMRLWGSYLGAANHASRVFIVELSGATWSVAKTLETGNSWGHGEAYGGVAWGPENGAQEKIVWMTSADTAWGAGPHGVQGTRPADFPVVSAIVNNSFRVPFDPAYDTSGPDYKGTGGDVDVMQESRCAEIAIDEIVCPDKVGNPFSVDLTIANNSTSTVVYAWFTPVPTSSLPAGAITAQPEPSTIVTLSTPVVTGDTFQQTVQLPGSGSGQKVCFRVTLLTETGEHCCTEIVCVDLPKCDCVEILDTKIACEPQADGTIKYTLDITIRNRTDFGTTPFDFAHVTFLPPTGFAPANVVPSPNPIPPGGSGTIHTCYYGAPGPIVFNLVVHDADLIECCSLEDVVIELPDCTGGGEPFEPDTCSLERRVPCRKQEGIPDGIATVHFVVCNNSTAPRTYTWTAAAISNPTCTVTLPASAFSPPSGVLGPVAPGSCATATVEIACRDFKEGDCAAYEICATFSDVVPPLCCDGEVFRPSMGDVIVSPGDGAEGAVVHVGSITRLSLVFENTGPEPIDTELALYDDFALLSFPTGGPPPRSSLRLPVRLPPGGVTTSVVEVSRWDDGHNAPDYTALIIRLADDLTKPILLAVPLRLAEEAARAFAITSLEIEQGPPERITLQVLSEPGEIYQVQESTNLRTWTDADGSLVDPTANPDGTFTGTGGPISCCVPCDGVTPRRYYRVVLVP